VATKKKSGQKENHTIQETLGDLEASKKKIEKKKKPSSSKKKEPTPKKSKPSSKKASDKSSKPKKKSSKKKSSKKKPAKKADPMIIAAFTKLPGVGQKLAERLVLAGYEDLEKLSRARPNSLAKKIDGLSSNGASNLITSAKDTLRQKEAKAEPAVEYSTEEESQVTIEPQQKLTDIPGVGAKLALAFERAGYTSVARLSRSRPDAVAAKVDGLSVPKATAVVNAAQKMEREQEIAIITGEPSPIIVEGKESTSDKKEKEAPVKKTKTAKKKASDEKPPKMKKAPKAPAQRSTKKKLPPHKPRPKPVRKSSGMTVPKAIADLSKQMKQQWAEAEERAKAPKTEEEKESQEETVEVLSLAADETTERIVETAIDILNETMMTGRPAFEIPSRSSDNIVWDEIRDLLLLGMKTISRPYHSLASVVDATRTARVMEIIYNLLSAHLHATKREVYYSDVNLFREQKYSDKIIEDVASMIQTTRDSVHIVASARGSAMGRVTIRDGGDLIDLTKMGTGGWAVTPFLDQLEIVESDAEFILLSEKDAAVMRLAEAKYWNRQPCIVLTGKGSGDIATRAFLKMLVKELEIPAFALVDSDPYGHYIYSVFLRGSKRLSYESPFIATPELKLLGVLSRDLDEYKIPKAVRIPMQPADVKRVRDMLKEPFVQKNKPWVEDLQLMLRIKEKAEIQAFASHSFEFLTDEYLPRKLDTGDWI
jgi:meiotic recombination protein SPO11